MRIFIGPIVIWRREAEWIVQRTYKELPFTFTETLSLMWLSYRWFLTTHCAVPETTSTVLYWRHTVSRQQLPFAQRSPDTRQSFLPTPQSSPGATAFLPLVSFVIIILLGLDFLLPLSKSPISLCTAEHLISKHRRSLGSYLSCQRSRWHRVTRARCWPGHPQCGGTAVTRSKPLLQKSHSPAPPCPFWTLQATKT